MKINILFSLFFILGSLALSPAWLQAQTKGLTDQKESPRNNNLSEISLLEHYTLVFDNKKTPVSKKLEITDTLLSLCNRLGQKEKALQYRKKAAILYQQSGECLQSYYHFKYLTTELLAIPERNEEQEAMLRDAYISMTINALQANLIEEGFAAAYTFLEKFPQAPHEEKAKIYSNMGGMLMYEGRMEESYTYHRKALYHLHLAHDKNASLVYNNYAGWFYIKGDIDSALYYLLLTKDAVSEKSGNDAEKNDTELYYHNLALIYSALGDKEIAYQYYQKALEAAGDEAEKSFRKAQILINTANAYLADNQLDKAEKYLLSGIHLAQQTGFLKVEAQGRILYADLLHRKDMDDSAYHQLLLSYYQRDTVLYTENNERTYRLRKDFEMNQIQKNLELSELNILKKRLTIAILAILICLLSGLMGYLIYRLGKEKKRSRMQSIHHRESRDRLNSDIEQKNRIIVSGSVNSTYKDEVLENIQLRVEDLLKKNLKNLEGETREEISQQCHRILQNIQSCKTEDRWALFISNFEASYPDFFKVLQQDNPPLTRGEKRLAALLASGMNAKEIAEIIHRTPNSVETFIYRLRKKLNIDKDTKTNAYFENLKDRSLRS